MLRSTTLLLAGLLAVSAAAPAFSDEEIDPATGLARSTVVRPLRDAAPPYPPAPPEGAIPLPGSARPHIALILPIASPSLGSVADAVRQGFLAAAEATGRSALPVVMMNVADDGPAVLEACRRAQSLGAELVVAGITRDGATAVARSDCPRIPVLTLNQPQDTELPAKLYSISLSLEQEARQAALLAVADGWRSVILISSSSPLARRVLEAFEREWARAAGEVGGRIVFDGTPEQAAIVKERIAASRGDIVFVALDQAAARAVRPYVSGMLPVYATSLSVDPRADAAVNVDLQGLRYVDMPWFVQPDHPAVMIYPVPRSPMSVEQERLYALGIDAYRLATILVQGQARQVTLDGVTGRISLDAGNQFLRALTPAEVDGGKVVPLRQP